MFEYSKKLVKQGCLVLYLSKNTPAQFKEILRKYNIRKYIRYVLNTYDMKLPKASPETMRTILKRFGVKPQEVIMIDDQDFNLVEPAKLGVHTILYKNSRQARQMIEKYL